MPSAPLRPCGHAGCPKLIREGSRCDEHKRWQKLSAHKRGYDRNWQDDTRPRILLRDNYQCQKCGRIVGFKPKDAHVDHIIPRAKGGSDEDSNLRTLCAKCNLSKGDREDR